MVIVVNVVAGIWVVLLLVVPPLAAYRGRGRLATGTVPRLRLYRGSAIGIAAIGLISLALDAVTGGKARAAVVPALPSGILARWSVAMVLAALLLWLLIQGVRRLRGRPLDAGYLHLMPQTGPERVAFAGVSLLAGLCEEFAFRGFCFLEIRAATGSAWLAAIVTTVGFGLGHAYQGPGGVLRTTTAGAVLVTPVLAVGALLPAMIGHAVLDLISGLATPRVARRLGLLPGEQRGEG